MKLMIQDLSTSLSQSMRSIRNQMVGAVRPHIYLHNNPTGNIKMQVCSLDGTVIGESATVNFSTVATAPEFHGVVTFYLDAYLLAGTDYLFKMVRAAVILSAVRHFAAGATTTI